MPASAERSRASGIQKLARQVGLRRSLGKNNATRPTLEDELFAMVSVPRDDADERHRGPASGTNGRRGLPLGWRALVADHDYVDCIRRTARAPVTFVTGEIIA